jgi:5-(carboxyamino)imidazole ribonucleotide synthase
LSPSERRVIPPGGTIGVLGSGQLGRMFALAARAMGYRIAVFSPDADAPAAGVADREFVADYLDLDRVREFARAVDVVTFEFENVPSETAAACAEFVPVRPGGEVLHVTQNRLREKTFLKRHGFPVAEFRHVTTLAELVTGLESLRGAGVLKTAGFGYDGKGQVKITAPDQAAAAWEAVSGRESVLEAFVEFEREVSVIAARGVGGEYRDFGVIENRHANHILDVSVCPATVSPSQAEEAREIARGVVERLDAVGVIGVEFFIARSGRVIVNEIAPRTHNSGHLTIEAFATSQFDQAVRAVCGLPLGSTERLRAAAMANLLGDQWNDGEPNWPAALFLDGVQLHLYGKSEPRPGRKMGHLTALAPTAAAAAALVRQARAALATGR